MNELIEQNDELQLSCNTPQQVLEQKIILEEDPIELKKIVDMYKLNLKKKDLLRSGKMSSLLDLVSDQMEARLEKRPGEFTNKELLEYTQVLNGIIDKNTDSLKEEDIPTVQINQQVNITNGVELTREQQERVSSVLKSIFSKIQSNNSVGIQKNSETNYIDIQEEDIEEVDDNL